MTLRHPADSNAVGWVLASSVRIVAVGSVSIGGSTGTVVSAAVLVEADE